MNILNRLAKNIKNSDKNKKFNVEFNKSKCLFENTNIENEKAIKKLKNILDNNDINDINDNLKSKIYCYYAIALNNNNNNNNEIVNEIINYFQLSTKFNKKNYKAWHYYALVNFKFYEFNQNISYANNAIIGLTKSVCIGDKNLSKVIQDLLRLIDIWFQVGKNSDSNELIKKSFSEINIESWLLVIPQLLARLGTNNETLRNSLLEILKKIGKSHPRSLNYQLIVMCKNQKRKKDAELILNDMKNEHENLIKECELIINELNRCALLLHEEWKEVIEESFKLFQGKDIKGMLKYLQEVNNKLEKKPETLNEVHFYQLYRKDLKEAKNYLDNYSQTKDEVYIKQALFIYYNIYKSILEENKSIFKSLYLENISPKLYNFKESEIEIPGIYRSNSNIIKISGFNKILTILSSKQHPRRLKMYGSDKKEYIFLLKGHEDLRQDERAMQLFGLVNSLLSNDADTKVLNLYIKRFPVLALSHNTGILGWVPNCDTLYQLIKEYRITNKIKINIEQEIMTFIYPKHKFATFLTKLYIFKYILQNTQGLDLYKVLWIKSKNAETWLDHRTNYSRSLAVMSMVGYILGLGDRHMRNIMLDRISGNIFHIDFGDCFEVAMKKERVPFRLTRMLVKALEVSGIEGMYKFTCENVMRVLRQNKDSLIQLLTAFVHDPLISFRLLIPLIMKKHNQFDINLKKEKSDENFEKNISNIRNSKNINVNDNLNLIHKFSDDKMEKNEEGFEKRRKGKIERQLYLQFEENEVESDNLNKIAILVLKRIIDKLQGTDFGEDDILSINQQVERLINQATSHENLCQNYIGWCPFW